MTMTCLVGRRSALAGGISVMAPRICRGPGPGSAGAATGLAAAGDAPETLGPVRCPTQSGTNGRKSRGRNSRFGGGPDALPSRMGRHARTDWIRKTGGVGVFGRVALNPRPAGHVYWVWG